MKTWRPGRTWKLSGKNFPLLRPGDMPVPKEGGCHGPSSCVPTREGSR
jgi:hypothetical protein